MLYGIEYILQTFTFILKVCEKWHVIPNIWCKSLVCLIYKNKGDSKNASNYRPISLTCIPRRIYERFILEKHKNKFENVFENEQGGFREKRNTLQQVFVLNEIMKNNPNMFYAFLDIQAAYDSVDRRLLWKSMLDYGFDYNFIKNLRALFDNNFCNLTINGVLSENINCKRGLLQGSSLSPFLFNMYINSLISKLKEKNKVVQGKIRTNCLFFADDGVIFGRTSAKLQLLLDKCSKWSCEKGIKFAPDKSIVIAPNKVNFYINNGVIPIAETFRYLGIEMNNNGVIWEKEFDKNIAKVRSTANWLKSKGMNGNGWRLNSCITVYKSFLRPIMEYGVCLGTSKSATEKLEKAQREILRGMISCRRTTSVEAMYKLFNITPMECRVSELQAKFYYRLKNLNNNNIIAYEMFLQCEKKKHQECFVTFVKKKNELYNFFINNDKKLFVKKVRELREKSIVLTNLFERHNIASAIEYIPNNSDNYLLNPKIKLEEQRLLLLWRLGMFTYHQSCAQCGLKATRDHALQCSGQNEYLVFS